jgi:hypothetical protein
MKNTADVTSGKPIAFLLQSIPGAINPLVAFYDMYGGKRERESAILLFYPGHHTRLQALAISKNSYC